MTKEQYQDYLKSADWQKIRRSKLAKTSRCAICLDTKRLDVHHLNYRNIFDVTTSDLRVLCHRCHFLAHDLMREGKLVYKGEGHHSRFCSTKSAVLKELRKRGDIPHCPRIIKKKVQAIISRPHKTPTLTEFIQKHHDNLRYRRTLPTK